MSKATKVTWILAGFVLAGVVGLSAQNKPQGSACRADREKFCKDVKPGQGRIWMCLKSHEDKLSAACQDHMAAMKDKHQDFVNACKADAKANCKDVKVGEGRILRCLKQNKSKLSPGCKAKFDESPKDEE